MASRDSAPPYDPRRDYRSRRPRYEDSDSDGYEPRPRRGGGGGRPQPRSVQSGPSQVPPPPLGDRQPRRKSILVDPNETASDRARRRSRNRSNVRLQTSDDDSDRPRERGAIPREGRPRHDLERKDSAENRQFRERRDGYLSDEGETLKKVTRERAPPRAPPSPAGGPPYPSERNGPPGPPGAYPESTLPVRGGPPPRAASAAPPPRDEPPPEHRARAPNYDTEPESRNIQRRRTTREPGERPRPRYRDYDDEGSDDYRRPPPRPREDPRRRPPPPRYPEEDRGYRSDHAPRRRDYDSDRDYRDPYARRRDDGYRSDHGPRPRPRAYADDDRDDPYRRDRGGRYDDRSADPRRDRYRDDRRRSNYDDYDRYGGSSRAARKANNDWQKQATALFMTHALPIIRKEGTRFVQREAQKYLHKRQGGGA